MIHAAQLSNLIEISPYNALRDEGMRGTIPRLQSHSVSSRT
jgi:hypothetical protein